MNLSFLIARRYLFSKKSHNAINIISGISVAGVAVVTAAMVIVLSVFNGFEGLVISLYNVFEAPVVIKPAEGKTLELSTIPTDKILETEGVIGIVEVLEESCLLRYRDKQYFARIKGVSDNFNALTEIDSMIIDGDAVDANFSLATRNVPHVDVLPAQGLNVYDVLKHDQLVLTKAAVEKIHARLGAGEAA